MGRQICSLHVKITVSYLCSGCLSFFFFLSFSIFSPYYVGAVFAMINHPSVCQEMVRDLVLDLPLLSSPVILLCMNKELRNHCVQLLQRNSSRHYMEGKSARERSRTSAGETEMMFLWYVKQDVLEEKFCNSCFIKCSLIENSDVVDCDVDFNQSFLKMRFLDL